MINRRAVHRKEEKTGPTYTNIQGRGWKSRVGRRIATFSIGLRQ